MTGAKRNQTRHPPCVDGGFTLIELLAVLVILAILAGTAVPTLNSLGASRSAMAGKQLLRDLNYARQRAVATGVRTWVVVNTGTESWSVLSENPSSPGRAGATVVTDFATGKPFVVTLDLGEYEGIGITSCNFDGGSEVGFDWLGKPLNSSSTSLAADGVITLSGGGQVTVRMQTGHITYASP